MEAAGPLDRLFGTRAANPWRDNKITTEKEMVEACVATMALALESSIGHAASTISDAIYDAAVGIESAIKDRDQGSK
jgi:hypothetical protein